MLALAALLAVAAVTTGLWPVSNDSGTNCGSFLASNDNAYSEAYQSLLSTMTNAAYESGVTSEAELGLPRGAFTSVARDVALKQVEECGSDRSAFGVVAGILLAASVLAAGGAGLVLAWAKRPAKAV